MKWFVATQVCQIHPHIHTGIQVPFENFTNTGIQSIYKICNINLQIKISDKFDISK